MSYFDDASLMFLAGGGAQKDGKAYSVKPVPEYGSELVTNGDFATNTWWTLGQFWSIANGFVTRAVVGSELNYSVSRSNLLTIGKSYKVEIDVNSVDSGSVKVVLGSTNGTEYTSAGVYIFEGVCTSSTNFKISPSSDFNGSIDNVSIKEVLVNGDFTFSRGSNLAATRVDADGLIEKGRENRFTQSNNFSTSPWTSSGTTETSGQSGYDGTSDAWLLNAASAGGYLYRGPSSSLSGVSTVSIYAKKGTADGVRLRLPASGSTDANVYINLIDGSDAKSATGVISHTVTSLGTGWYRIQMTFSVSSPINFRIFPANSSGSVVGGTIYIQDTQSEIGLAATEYIESGATTGTAGILENTPRFDYSNGATCPSLLLEPSRSNLIQSSEYFGAWGITNGSVTANNLVSPEGLINGTKFQITGASVLSQTITSVAGTATTFSVFAKSGNHSIFRLGNVSSTQRAAWFDLSTGTKLNVNGGTSTIENYGNGWYRCTASFTSSVDGIYFIALSASGGSTAAPSSGSNINIYGAMVESNASFASSYIPNHSGGTITRAADVCGGAGDASTFNDSEGVLYAEIASLVGDEAIGQISVSNGSDNENVKILWLNANKIRLEVKTVSGTNFVKDINVERNGDFYKLAIQYKSNDYKVYVNGISQAVSQVASTPNGLIKLNFNRGDGSSVFYGNVKQILVFNTALSDADLATLTTI